jgi:hypothetical protein
VSTTSCAMHVQLVDVKGIGSFLQSTTLVQVEAFRYHVACVTQEFLEEAVHCTGPEVSTVSEALALEV